MSFEDDVKEFRGAFDLPVNKRPTLLSDYDTQLHMKLLKEEFTELVHAVNDRDIVEIFDALIDIQYVAMGMGVHMGLPMQKGWEVVHRSNLSKLDENGKPMYHDGSEGPKGKVKKSDRYEEPQLGILLSHPEVFEGKSVTIRTPKETKGEIQVGVKK